MENEVINVDAFLAKALADAKEAQNAEYEATILRYFGSEERVKYLAKYYVIQEEPMQMSIDDQLYDNTVKISFHTKYRIRLKTPEEFAHERAEEILKAHAVVGKCITCEEDIHESDKHIRTIHGLYHLGDRNCVEGRAE